VERAQSRQESARGSPARSAVKGILDVKESVAGFIEDFIGRDDEESPEQKRGVLQDSPQTLHKRIASNGPEVIVSPVSGERRDKSNKENEFDDDFDESNLGVDEANDQPQLMTPGIRSGKYTYLINLKE